MPRTLPALLTLALTSGTATATVTAIAAVTATAIAAAAPALAQTSVPKLQSLCPMGYVDNFKGGCVSPINYTLQPTNGKPCPGGWMNVGGGYCKKKELGIF